MRVSGFCGGAIGAWPWEYIIWAIQPNEEITTREAWVAVVIRRCSIDDSKSETPIRAVRLLMVSSLRVVVNRETIDVTSKAKMEPTKMKRLSCRKGKFLVSSSVVSLKGLPPIRVWCGVKRVVFEGVSSSSS
jgi:hypothetical protein